MILRKFSLFHSPSNTYPRNTTTDGAGTRPMPGGDLCTLRSGFRELPTHLGTVSGEFGIGPADHAQSVSQSTGGSQQEAHV